MNRDKEISGIRNEYSYDTLSKNKLDQDPVKHFKKWLSEAINNNLPEPTAMVLSTVSSENKPSSRTVLLKYIENNKFIFFTNYNSKKGREIEKNPFASLLFFWEQFNRQVRIEGVIKKTENSLSEKYFNSRPTESKISAIISNQSKEIPNREYLENLKNKLIDSNAALNKPKNWGGYALMPELIEFWQGRPGRLHDRIEFRLTDKTWKYKRLAP